jgi:hypothetical protein
MTTCTSYLLRASRHMDHQALARIYSTGWRPQFSLKDGIGQTYPWVDVQVQTRRAGSASGLSARLASRSTSPSTR